MMLDEVMKNNESFVKEFEPKKMSYIPPKKTGHCNMYGYQGLPNY